MGFLDNLGESMAGMLDSPEGQEMVKKFLAPSEGQNMVIRYASTPKGKQFLGIILLGVVDKLNLTTEQKGILLNIALQQMQGAPEAKEHPVGPVPPGSSQE
jgi:hypothetical protein